MLNGHGSHVTMEFLNWDLYHKIFIAVFPPHASHKLQPLDVKLFAPLSTCYSNNLSQHRAESQSLSAISKRDFFRLFWPVWQSAFTAKNIQSGLQATGLFPLNSEVVLRQIDIPYQQLFSLPCSCPVSSDKFIRSEISYRQARALIEEVISYHESEKVKKLDLVIHNLTAQVAILKAENEGYQRALKHEKKKRKRGKTVQEELRADGQQGGMFWAHLH